MGKNSHSRQLEACCRSTHHFSWGPIPPSSILGLLPKYSVRSWDAIDIEGVDLVVVEGRKR